MAEPIEPIAGADVEPATDDDARGRGGAVTRGRFVVFEGGDGSGKSTQAARLATWLRAQGVAVHETFEPGAGATGAVIRELLLHGPESIEPTAEALLMAADRAAARRGRDRARAGARRVGRVRPVRAVVARVPGRGARARRRLVEQLSAVATAGPRARPRARVRRHRRRRRGAARAASPTDSSARAPSSTPRCGAAYRELAPARGWVVVDGNGDSTTSASASGPRSRRCWQDDGHGGVGHELRALGAVVGQDRAVAQLQRAAGASGARLPARRAAGFGHRGGGPVLRGRGDRARRQRARVGSRRSAACIPTSSRSIRRPRRSGSRTRRPSSTRCRAARSRASARSIVLFDAERLRLNEAAANKLLKTLEEPPPRAMIVLVTSGADQLLPTIRSRCQRVDFAFLNADAVATALRASGVAPERAELLAAPLGRTARPRPCARRSHRAGARRVRRGRGAVDGTGGAVARQAELVQERAPGGARPSSRPRRPRRRSSSASRARGRRLPRTHRSAPSCAGSRSGTSARTAAPAPTRSLEGITALETVYRDAMAGPAPSRSTSITTLLVLAPRAAAARTRRVPRRPPGDRRVQPERDAARRAAAPPPPRRGRRLAISFGGG